MRTPQNHRWDTGQGAGGRGGLEIPRPSPLAPRPFRDNHGFTLAEIVLGAMVLAVAAAAILGAYVGQVTLNEHARNLSLAIQDANRVIERIRQKNASCGAAAPDASPLNLGVAENAADWDTWLGDAAKGGGKSIQPDPANNEFVYATCQNNQFGTVGACNASGDPIRVTVAVCWRHRGRIIGECAPIGAGLIQQDGAGSGRHLLGGVIESPAMLTTLVTCRG